MTHRKTLLLPLELLSVQKNYILGIKILGSDVRLQMEARTKSEWRERKRGGD